MYLDSIYWIMDNSSLWLLEGQWRERKGDGGRKKENIKTKWWMFYGQRTVREERCEKHVETGTKLRTPDKL